VGYRGRVEDRERARGLRAGAWTLQQIADEVGVARSTVSLWVRDVVFTPGPRNRGAPSQPVHPLRVAKLEEIERLRADGVARIGELSRKGVPRRWSGPVRG
jgi:transcriptional regulator with XRE-family HTH domain